MLTYSNTIPTECKENTHSHRIASFRVLLFIGSLRPGGAERVITRMSNYWAERGWDIIVATADDGVHPPFQHLDPRVRQVPLALISHSRGGLGPGERYFPLRVFKLRNFFLITKPDVIISFMHPNYITALLAAWRLDIPVIVGNRNNARKRTDSLAWSVLQKITYPLASRIVEQTENGFEHIPQALRTRVRVIPNPVVAPPAPRLDIGNPARNTQPCVVAMGRLVHQKGFDLLIQAFASIASKHPAWKLEIWGEGTERHNLETLCKNLGLSQRIYLPGLTSQPFDVFRNAEIFVLSSRYEGFPNVLTEAMSVGIPAISFACPHGPASIIRNGVDGILVPPEDVEGLAFAMDGLMENARQRKHLGEEARQVIERFGVDSVMLKWGQVINEVTRDV